MDAITEAQSLEDVVSAINQAAGGNGVSYFGGTDMRSAEDMAGQYALSATMDEDYWDEAEPEDSPDVFEKALDAHLEILEKAGAKFDHATAVKEALELYKQQKSE